MEGFMNKRRTSNFCLVMTALFSVLLMLAAASFAGQEKKLDPKLLAELVGNYEFNIQGQTGVFIFTSEEGNLRGAPAGDPQSELEPVEGEEMTFVGHSPDGAEFQFKFLRDEQGNIAKCIVSIPAMGLVADMFKIEK
jgi:hypothetical protein